MAENLSGKVGRAVVSAAIQDNELQDRPASYQPLCILDIDGKLFKRIIDLTLKAACWIADRKHAKIISYFEKFSQLLMPLVERLC